MHPPPSSPSSLAAAAGTANAGTSSAAAAAAATQWPISSGTHSRQPSSSSPADVAVIAAAANRTTSQHRSAPPASYMRLSRISCDPCRKRKLRCDRVMPCATCVRRGIADQCYREEGREDQQAIAASTTFHAANPSTSSSHVRTPSSADERKRKRIQPLDASPLSPYGEDSLYDGEESVMASTSSDVEKLERILLKAQDQLSAIAGAARDSSGSLDAALRTIQAGRGIGQSDRTSLHGSGLGGLIRWKDVAAHLPSIDECEELIRFYFEDLAIYIQINQRSLIDKYWHKLLEGHGLERNKMSVICTILAMADGTAPPNTFVRRRTMKEHDHWIQLMGNPMVTLHEESVDNSFERVMALGLLAIYNLYMGRHDRLWEYMGATVRRGYIIGLFDERHPNWHGLTNLEAEYRRRLAWYMVSLERLQAFMRQLPFALHQDYIYLALPSFQPDGVVARGDIAAPRIMPTFPVTLPDGTIQTNMSANDGRTVKFVLIELSAACHDFLRNFTTLTPSQRYSRAARLDEVLERTLIDGLEDSGIDLRDLHYSRFLSSQVLDTCHTAKQVGVNLWVSSIFFFRCVITRRVLTDEGAPQSLRFVSLTYAQGIVSTVPSLMRLVKEARHPIQMTWNANHLLCAATAFAVVILGHDPYAGIDVDPVRSLHGTARRTIFPQQQVQWLADNIFSTLECLEMLVERGNAAATVAKNVLERLCGSQEELRAMYRKRFSAWRENESFRAPLLGHRGGGVEPTSSPYRSPVAASYPFHPTPPPSGGTSTSALPSVHPQQQQQQHLSVPSGSSSASSSGPSATHHRPLPPIQSYPTPVQRPVSSASAAAFTTTTPIVGRFMNASALLDAVLMEPPDLSFLGQSSTSDLLATLTQEATEQLTMGA